MAVPDKSKGANVANADIQLKHRRASEGGGARVSVMSAVGGGMDDRIARSKALLEKHRNTQRSSSRAAPSPAADVPLATPPRASTAVAAAGGWPMGAADAPGVGGYAGGADGATSAYAYQSPVAQRTASSYSSYSAELPGQSYAASAYGGHGQ